MKLVSVQEMLSIEKEADAGGLSYADMLENAGRGLAALLDDLDLVGRPRDIAGLVGPGNNGGDALVALAELAASGWTASAYLVHRDEDHLVERMRKAGGRVLTVHQDEHYSQLSDLIRSAEILVDGLLGTGSKPPITGDVAAVLERTDTLLQQLTQPPYVVAVDCPSGIDCDTGEVPEHCIPADLTVTMAAVKQGLLRLPAYDYVGDLQVVDIGLPAGLPSLGRLTVDVANASLVSAILPTRSSDSHKGTFGTAVVVAGSAHYTGAALLAGTAAYRSGAGLVTLAVPAVLHAALAGHLPEATWLLLPHELGVISKHAANVLAAKLGNASALLIGPGLGTDEATADFVERLFQPRTGSSGEKASMGFVGAHDASSPVAKEQLPPTVVDADGLKLLTRIPDWPRRLPASSILTPHPGEMAALTGLARDDIQRNRLSLAIKYAREWGHVVVLKGAFTVIAAPDGAATLIPVATAALAKAGTGDVLAGLIVGLRAQGVGPYEASVAGAWIHAQAGLYAASNLGNNASVLAGDVLRSVADVLSGLPTS